MNNISYIIHFAWNKRKGILWLCIILAILAVLQNFICMIVTPVILIIIESSVSVNTLLLTIFLFSGALFLVGTANTYFNTKVPFEHASFRIILTSHIMHKIETMSFPLTENQDVLKKLDRAMMSVVDTNSPTQAIWVTLTNLLSNGLGIIIYFGLLSSFNPFIIGMILLLSLLSFLINRKHASWNFSHREEEAEYSRQMTYVSNKAGESATMKDICIFGISKWLNDVYKSNLHLYKAFIFRREKKYLFGDLLNVILTFARNGIAYLYLINLVVNSKINAPQFLLYFSAVGGFAIWVNGILQSFTDLHKNSLEIDTMRELLDYKEPFIFNQGKIICPDNTKEYEIELKNVSFQYPAAEKYILKNINLTIKAGEKLAVVGLNGTGKSTLVKLICGFYDPTEGEILLNGVNIKEYNRNDYYRHFSAVFQNFSVLPITIAENIAQSESINMNKLKLCVKKAGLTEKIESLPQKYETHIGKTIYEDSIELSGGEIQRLMLARALYKDAPIIVLDEPTAALDSIAENEMYMKYNDITGNHTSIFISHRLASTRFCDRIILIGNQSILEEGTHYSLLRKNGEYAKLFIMQSQYYQEV